MCFLDFEKGTGKRPGSITGWAYQNLVKSRKLGLIDRVANRPHKNLNNFFIIGRTNLIFRDRIANELVQKVY